MHASRFASISFEICSFLSFLALSGLKVIWKWWPLWRLAAHADADPVCASYVQQLTHDVRTVSGPRCTPWHSFRDVMQTESQLELFPLRGEIIGGRGGGRIALYVLLRVVGWVRLTFETVWERGGLWDMRRCGCRRLRSDWCDTKQDELPQWRRKHLFQRT